VVKLSTIELFRFEHEVNYRHVHYERNWHVSSAGYERTYEASE